MNTNLNCFYSSISPEHFRAISSKLSNRIAAGYGYRTYENYQGNQMPKMGFTYIIAQLSNGKFYTRFDKGVDFDSIYRGQCEVANWFDIDRVYADQEYSFGIQCDGKIVTTLQEADLFIKHLSSQNSGSLQAKQIVEMYDKEHVFLGLDGNGKVIINQPEKLFHLRENDPRENEYCTSLVHTIRSWPPLKRLYKGSYALIGLTEDGQVYCTATRIYQSTEEKKILDKLSSLSDIDSLVFLQRPSDYSEYLVVLTKNGLVFPIAFSSIGSVKTNFSDVVQILADGQTLLHLNLNGTLYAGNHELDTNVVSLFPRGYVRADGTVYVKEFVNSNTYFMIPDLKLFDNIDRIEEEWEAARKITQAYKKRVVGIRQELAELEQKISDKNRKIDILQSCLSGLGIFKQKEKKETKANIEQIQGELSKLNQERENLKTGFASSTDLAPRWKRIDLKAQRDALVARVQKMAATPIVSEKAKDISVLKSAAVGAVLAGPSGAIVGAIYALDKNIKANQLK